MLKIVVIISLIVASILTVVTTSSESSEIYFEWKIDNFFDLPTEDDYYLYSPEFTLARAKWVLQMYTNGSSADDTRGFVSMYLNKYNSEEEYLVYFTIGFKAPNGSEIVSDRTTHTFTDSASGWGFEDFLERSALESLIPEGSLIVFCKAQIMNSSKVLSESTSSIDTGNLSDNFKELYISKLFSDVKLIVKGREFSAHKNVLSCRLTDFGAMRENIPDEVEIPDCDPDSFEEFLLFVYTGKLDTISMKKAMNLYLTADKYNLTELMDKCALSIVENDLNLDSFYDIFLFANMHGHDVLLKGVTKFLFRNTRSILLNKRWENLMKNSPLLLTKLVLTYSE